MYVGAYGRLLCEGTKERFPNDEGFVDITFPLCGLESPITQAEDSEIAARSSQLADQLRQEIQECCSSWYAIKFTELSDKFREV